ncbi:MAG: bifunctional riboflavin kinase/FAD synthetase [Candidatus Competibacterales bacterium]|nr:bifunctional riboflavin kinase/FAD synthetase [Candidatus Competibacterales bacterium]
MELIRGWHNLRPRHRGCALAIGNFDGVHRGHQAVLEQLARVARDRELPATLMLFEPQPREFLTPERAPPRLTRLREKLEALRSTPLERVLCLRFDRHLAALTPERFIERLLVEQLGVRVVVVGDDFRFGHEGRGDVALLRAAGRRHGFEVRRCARFELDRRRVSSSWVREALAAGRLDQATQLLGRPYRLCGRIARGDRIGRTLGFPTANLPLQRRHSPLSGVFAVRMTGIATEPWPGVANIGRRPTVDGTELRLEVHLFDFDDDLYGRHVSVEFTRRIRDERPFRSLDELRAQIDRDAADARAWFGLPEVGA